MDGEQVQYVELTFDSLERITLEVLKEMFEPESNDLGLKWE